MFLSHTDLVYIYDNNVYGVKFRSQSYNISCKQKYLRVIKIV
jgi:hypothetical protein